MEAVRSGDCKKIVNVLNFLKDEGVGIRNLEGFRARLRRSFVGGSSKINDNNDPARSGARLMGPY